jgi:hypothetical protein
MRRKNVPDCEDPESSLASGGPDGEVNENQTLQAVRGIHFRIVRDSGVTRVASEKPTRYRSRKPYR